MNLVPPFSFTLPGVVSETPVLPDDVLETVEVVCCVSLPVEEGVAVVGTVVPDDDVEALVDSSFIQNVYN